VGPEESVLLASCSNITVEQGYSAIHAFLCWRLTVDTARLVVNNFELATTFYRIVVCKGAPNFQMPSGLLPLWETNREKTMNRKIATGQINTFFHVFVCNVMKASKCWFKMSLKFC